MGGIVPPPDASGFRNEPIRQALLARLNANSEYRRLFGERFPSVAAGGPIDFTMFGRAIAEFEFTLVRANAPLDRYARGDRSAMTRAEKRGALVFFGTGGCVRCHAVAGEANEMFSDFRMHVAAFRNSRRCSAWGRETSSSTGRARTRTSASSKSRSTWRPLHVPHVAAA